MILFVLPSVANKWFVLFKESELNVLAKSKFSFEFVTLTEFSGKFHSITCQMSETKKKGKSNQNQRI